MPNRIVAQSFPCTHTACRPPGPLREIYHCKWALLLRKQITSRIRLVDAIFISSRSRHVGRPLFYNSAKHSRNLKRRQLSLPLRSAVCMGYIMGQGSGSRLRYTVIGPHDMRRRLAVSSLWLVMCCFLTVRMASCATEPM